MLEKINKKEARKRFNKGESILFIPCKLNPYSPWDCGIWYQHKTESDHDFDSVCTAVWWYNCNSE